MKRARATRWRLLSISAAVAAIVASGAAAQTATYTRLGGRAAASAPARVEVFTNGAILLTQVGGATVYQLDGLQQLEAELSQGLPGDEASAQRIALERMKRLGPALQLRVANAGRGLMLAREYGVERVPAVVIDGKAVVYGMTDVAEAVAAYRAKSKGRP